MHRLQPAGIELVLSGKELEKRKKNFGGSILDRAVEKKGHHICLMGSSNPGSMPEESQRTK